MQAHKVPGLLRCERPARAAAAADLRTLAAALQAFGARADALELDGEPVQLDARQALSVSLVLHELATNATKHGALAVPEGRVRLSWHLERADAGRRLCLRWVERGGRPVTPPRESGFGTQLIRRAFAFELAGTADLAFEPEGVRLEASFPLS